MVERSNAKVMVRVNSNTALRRGCELYECLLVIIAMAIYDKASSSSRRGIKNNVSILCRGLIGSSYSYEFRAIFLHKINFLFLIDSS